MNRLIQDILSIPEENIKTEFKRLNGNKVVSKIIETIVAFANTEGGNIILGVDDPEKTKLRGIDRIFGIEENLELFDEIFREAQRITPPYNQLDVTKIEIKDNKTVAIISVPKAVDGFHSIDNAVFCRLAKGNKKLSPVEIVKLSYAKGFSSADKELVNVDFALLKTKHYEDWKTNRSLTGKNIEENLYNTGLARKDNGELKPTLAAVLLFALYPTDITSVKCAVKISRYVGVLEKFNDTPNMIGTPKIINAPLIELIRQTQEYVLTLLQKGIEIHSGFVTKYELPERSIKETITNAIIHRDYHIQRDIEIKIFEDRVEIINPGLFPYNITRENIGYVRSDGYRNDLIVKHLREFPAPPNLDQNEGVRAIRNEMKNTGLYPPIYISYPMLDDSVEVVLLNEKTTTEWEAVKQYLDDNTYITNQEARNITHVVQTDKMSKLLTRWTKQGLLLRIESSPTSKRDIKYKLADKGDLNDNK